MIDAETDSRTIADSLKRTKLGLKLIKGHGLTVERVGLKRTKLGLKYVCNCAMSEIELWFEAD